MASENGLREQRRQRILENSRSRMDRILGMAGEAKRQEPIIDGLRNSRTEFPGTVRSRNDENSIDGDSSFDASADSGEANVAGDNGLTSVREKSSPARKLPQPLTSKIAWILRRRIIFFALGIILRLALWFDLIHVDSKLIPYIFALSAAFEASTLIFPMKWTEFTALRGHPGAFNVSRVPNGISIIFGHLLEDFFVSLAGFIVIHFLCESFN